MTKLRLIGSDFGARQRDDFYPTPPAATLALLGVEQFAGTILEPACGDGALSRVLETAGHRVVSADLIDRGYGEGGLDFLGLGYPHRAENVVTNPPFKLATEFAERALDLTTGKVALLMRLAALEGRARGRFFARTPLARVWVFSGRLTMSAEGTGPAKGGMLAFAWMVWDHAHDGPPTLGWLP